MRRRRDSARRRSNRSRTRQAGGHDAEEELPVALVRELLLMERTFAARRRTADTGGDADREAADERLQDTLRRETRAGEHLVPVACCGHAWTTPDAAAEFRYVSVYSGPEPPSGGVRRPPLAVIAPHCTQFDGARFTVTVPSPPSTPISYTCAGHMCTHMSATSRGTLRSTRMWFGWSSRVLFPDAKTDESLSKISLPSGAGYRAARPVRRSGCSASGSARIFPRSRRPFETVIALASAPPTKNPRPNTCRMSRTSWRSLWMKLCLTASSYEESAVAGVAPPRSEAKPPLGIVFAPQATRSPPSSNLRSLGCVFSSWGRSCGDSSTSR